MTDFTFQDREPAGYQDGVREPAASVVGPWFAATA